jgi:hypothetical protein
MNINYYTDLSSSEAYEIINDSPEKDVLVYIHNSHFITIKVDRDEILDILDDRASSNRVAITELTKNMVIEFV